MIGWNCERLMACTALRRGIVVKHSDKRSFGKARIMTRPQTKKMGGKVEGDGW